MTSSDELQCPGRAWHGTMHTQLFRILFRDGRRACETHGVVSCAWGIRGRFLPDVRVMVQTSSCCRHMAAFGPDT